jgi:hypothetical protein
LNTTIKPHAPIACETGADKPMPDLPDRVRVASELLEAIAADRGLLDTLAEADRVRLHQAVSQVHHPEPRARRRKHELEARARHQDKVRRTEALLDQTGIRSLRRKPVFTTPNCFPPQAPGQHDPRNTADDTSALQQSPELLHCYVCKQKYSRVHHFYDQLCPPCADLNFRKRTETADLRGRVALLTLSLIHI